EIEAQVKALQESRAALRKEKGEEEENEDADERIGLGQSGNFDTDIYEGNKGKFDGYVTSIAASDEPEEDDEFPAAGLGTKNKYSAPLNILNDLSREEKDFDPLADHRVPRIADREDEYRAKRRHMVLSPGARHDPFDAGKNLLYFFLF
uniref:Splicing factor 3B subunit 1 domain-containing protein n=1 Tax=Capitella teleta TaxID=283909 RepID=X2B439_CAPTE